VNRVFLRYPYPITAVVLLIFAWVVFQRLAHGVEAVIPLATAAVIVWLPTTMAFVYFWPRITVAGFKRAILTHGFGGGPIPINTLYAVPERPSASASSSSLIATGTDDLVYLGGWLEVGAGPRVLHVPEMAGRYYSLQLTDPVTGANFAYVGKRATGTGPGDFLLCSPSWTGGVPDTMRRIDVPHRSALVVGRVFAADDDDRQEAFALAKEMQLSGLDGRQ
jgi:hypothetical protein